MEELKSCKDCFYSCDTYELYPCTGRDTNGIEVESEDCFFSSVTCYANPEPKTISQVNGDIEIEPEYHRCGQGRWWIEGKWIGWTELEEYENGSPTEDTE